MGQLIAYDACVQWVNLTIKAMFNSATSILEMWEGLPLSAVLAYLLAFAVIGYLTLRKYFSEAWRSNREMKKKRRLKQEQAMGDDILDSFLKYQGQGLFTAEEVNKMMKRLGHVFNWKDLTSKRIEKQRLSQCELKAELKAKHKANGGAAVAKTVEVKVEEKPLSLKEKLAKTMTTKTAHVM